MVEIAELDTVVEEHPVPLPVEAVGQQDLPGRAGRNTLQVLGRRDAISDPQIDLTLMWDGEGMRFPDRHRHIVPDRARSTHVHRAGDGPRTTERRGR